MSEIKGIHAERLFRGVYRLLNADGKGEADLSFSGRYMVRDGEGLVNGTDTCPYIFVVYKTRFIQYASR